jgi:hypothetical protein
MICRYPHFRKPPYLQLYRWGENNKNNWGSLLIVMFPGGSHQKPKSDETGSDGVRVISDPPKTEITSKTGG